MFSTPRGEDQECRVQADKCKYYERMSKTFFPYYIHYIFYTQLIEFCKWGTFSGFFAKKFRLRKRTRVDIVTTPARRLPLSVLEDQLETQIIGLNSGLSIKQETLVKPAADSQGGGVSLQRDSCEQRSSSKLYFYFPGTSRKQKWS